MGTLASVGHNDDLEVLSLRRFLNFSPIVNIIMPLHKICYDQALTSSIYLNILLNSYIFTTRGNLYYSL